MPDVSDRRVECVGGFGSLRLRSWRDGDRHVIALAGELDLATKLAVERELARAEGTDARFIVLDLRELEFIDSSGVRVVVMAYRGVAGRLVIVKGSAVVHRVFELCDLVRRLPFVADLPPDAAG